MRTQEKLREDLFKCLVYTGLAKQDDEQKVMEKLDKTLFYHILRFPHHANLHHVLARVVAQKFRGGKRRDHLGREIENYRIPSQWLAMVKVLKDNKKGEK